MGIPGVLKYFSTHRIFRTIVQKATPPSCTGSSHIKLLIDGTELVYFCAKKRESHDWDSLMKAVHREVDSLVAFVKTANHDDVPLSVFLAFGGVVPEVRLWRKRERVYVENIVKDSAFPTWFVPYEVTAGVQVYERALKTLLSQEWDYHLRISMPSSPGEADYKISEYIKYLTQSTALIFAGCGSELFLLGLRTASANLSRNVHCLLLPVHDVINVINSNALVREMSSYLDDGIHVEDFVRDFSAMVSIIGGDSVLPRSAEFDIYNKGVDAALKAYARLRQFNRRARFFVDDKTVIGRKVPHFGTISEFFNRLADQNKGVCSTRSLDWNFDRDHKSTTARARNDIPLSNTRDYVNLLKWTLSYLAGGGVPSWSWSPNEGCRCAPSAHYVHSELVNSVGKISAPYFEVGKPQDPRQQLAAILPPKLYSRYLDGKWLDAALSAARTFRYPSKIENLENGFRWSPRSRFLRPCGVGLDKVRLLKIDRDRIPWTTYRIEGDYLLKARKIY